MNRENLEKLAAYLEKLPEGYKHFNMAHFCENRNERTISPSLVEEEINYCGTTACAVGHGPLAGIPLDVQAYIKEGWTLTDSWVHYSYDNFVSASDAWDWCFGGGWSATDNTPQGAAKRIRVLLEKGVPDNSREQELGYDSLSY